MYFLDKDSTSASMAKHVANKESSYDMFNSSMTQLFKASTVIARFFFSTLSLDCARETG